MIKWNFPPNNFGQVLGFNDTGIVTFQGEPIKSLAREICQNSLDAKLNNEPVEVEFSTFRIPTEDLPGRNELLHAVEACADFVKDYNDQKPRRFFKNAARALSLSSIELLRISDYNTTGLLGSDKELNTDWTNLIKSAGSSDKSVVSGGSFGIGKFAPFASSKLRTVFYSTLDKTGSEAHQGVARLITFRNSDNETTQGTGYYGDSEKNKPVFEQLNLDTSHNRTKPGTDIMVAGFKKPDNYLEDIVTSVIDGFFWAIWKNELIVKVDGREISADNLEFLIDEFEGKFKGKADKYYSVINSPDKNYYCDDNFLNMGRIEMFMEIRKDLHRKVAMVRKTGMKIFDKSGLSTHIPFAAVLYISGSDINEHFREMENPQHNKWEPHRSQDASRARKTIKELNNWIKDCLNQAVRQGSPENLDAEGVGEYLPDIEEEKHEDEPSEKIETISKDKPEISAVHVSRKPVSDAVSTDDNLKGDDADMLEGGELDNGEKTIAPNTKSNYKSREGSRVGHPSTGSGGNTHHRVLVNTKDVRLFCVNEDNKQYKLLFTPEKDDADGEVILVLSGEQNSKKAFIKSAWYDGRPDDKLDVNGSSINGVIFNKGRRVALMLELDYPVICSMEIKAYGNKA